jgi:hypothetical protein
MIIIVGPRHRPTTTPLVLLDACAQNQNGGCCHDIRNLGPASAIPSLDFRNMEIKAAAAVLVIIAALAAWWLPRHVATPRREATEDELRALTEKLVAHVQRHVYLDDSRERFVTDSCETLTQLVTGRLVNADRYRRSLLGRKNIGKTYLLRALQEAAQAVLGASIITCFVDYSAVRYARVPTDRVVAALGWRWQAWWRCWVPLVVHADMRLAHLEKALAEADPPKYVFGVVDELQNVYKRHCTRGTDIIDELSALGASKAGVMHWIISGSSQDLRALITAKLPQERLADFPNYAAVDLNGTKFVPKNIFSFLSVSDCRPACRQVASDAKVPLDSRTLDPLRNGELYLHTGGVAGSIRDALKRRDPPGDAYLQCCKGLGRRGDTPAKHHAARAVEGGNIDGNLEAS